MLLANSNTFTTPILTDTTTYYVETIENGCTSQRTIVDVNVLTQLPIADFTMTPDSGIAPITVSFTNTSINTTDFQWIIKGIATTTNPNPMTFDIAGDYLITLIANPNACPDTITKTLIVRDEEVYLYIPNVFSPNSDGLNDNFNVKSQGLSTVSIIIFDRWGLNCYESNSTNFQWNGTRNGSACPEGVYVYVLDAKDAKGKRIYRTGSITLVR